MQRLRTPFLDDVSAAETGRRGPGARRIDARAAGRARVVGHQMSLDYALEYPVDDPEDDDDDDDFDEDEDGDEDEDEGDPDQETWQVSKMRPFR